MMESFKISRKHALVAASLVLFLFAISLGMFAIAQPTQNVEPALLGTSTPLKPPATAHPDWKDYTNPAFGYSLKYPPNMVYREWQPAADILQSVSFYSAEDIDKPLYLVPEVSVTIFANPDKKPSRDWMLERSAQAANAPQRTSAASFEGSTNAQPTNIAGIQGMAFSEDVGEAKGERVVVSRDNTVFSMAFTNFGDPKLKSTTADILSTVRWSTPQNPIQIPEFALTNIDTGKMNIGPNTAAAQASSNLGYKLPWTLGDSYRLIQSWGGMTHKCPGQSCYAYDFDNGGVSFEGVPIRAANDGTVVFVRGRSSPNACGGYDYRNLANYVTVYHPDGTATLYLHLKQPSVGTGPLANGRGTVIGLAGKTGWTGCYAHLHFQRQAQGAWAANSVPAYFDEYPNQQLKTLERYTSQNGSGGTSVCNNPSPTKDQIGLYQHANYCGTYKILGVGNYPNPSAMDFPNDSLSSIKVGSNVSATLCRDDNFAGGCVSILSDDADLSNNSVGNDTVSSVIISQFHGGWKGEYFNNQNLSGVPALVRSDSTINFDWGYGSPAPGIQSDHFSARWTQTLTLSAGTWRFTATADDGVRLWVDDRLVIDKWINQKATSYSVDLAESAGEHRVRMEYYEDTGTALARLDYGIVSATTGSGWRGQYYNNMTLSGSPVLERDDPEINFDWGSGSPAASIGADRFSVRWTRTLNLIAGTWRFTATVDDGVRLWVDDKLVIDKWFDQSPTSYSADVALAAGNHAVKMEYFEDLGNAVAKLSYSQVNVSPPGSGWRGQYYNNMTLSGSPALEREDAGINFDWGRGSPSPGIGADHFSVRWTRTLTLAAGTWRFIARADDGVRLWVDDRLLIDKWIDQSATSYSADVTVTAGAHIVRVEYYENTGDAVVRLDYTLLAPTSGNAWHGQYYNNMTLSGTPSFERDDADINFNWGRQSPGTGIGAEHFSVRWTRTLTFAAGTWRFTVRADDGARLWLDDRLLIDKWIDQSATSYSADVVVPAGNHLVKLEYYQNFADAVASLAFGMVSAASARTTEQSVVSQASTPSVEATPIPPSVTSTVRSQEIPPTLPNTATPIPQTIAPSATPSGAPSTATSSPVAPTPKPSTATALPPTPTQVIALRIPTATRQRTTTSQPRTPTQAIAQVPPTVQQSTALPLPATPTPEDVAVLATPETSPTNVPPTPTNPLTTFCGGAFGMIVLGMLGAVKIGSRIRSMHVRAPAKPAGSTSCTSQRIDSHRHS